MKTKKLFAALTALVCCAAAGAMPAIAADSGNRDQVYESSLILDDDTAAVWGTLSAFLWDSENLTRRIPAYTVRTQKGKICVVCDNDDVLETVKAFVAEAGFTAAQNALIEYRVESLENEGLTGGAPEPAQTQPIDSALILDDDTAAVWGTLSAFLWDSETNTKRIPAYTVRTQEGKICVVCDNDDVMETVKAFVAEAGFTAARNALIEYQVESLENEGLTGGSPEPAQTQPIDSALILDDDTAAVWGMLSAFLWDSENLTRRIPAYTVRTQEGKICVVCDNDDVLETVKAFVAEAGFTAAQNALIEYRVEPLENEVTDGAVSPAETTDIPVSVTLPGDVNAEGNVTVSDAILLARIVAEDITVSVTQQGMKNADMNANGAPDQDDIVLLLRQIAGIK